ncbi:MAG: ATP-binding protein [Pseudodesulfovibrio sp.]|uniref:ATP-binding region ATPase domain protein n=1 Tax=Pseudodesulfovibrio aespoeensis (strain ATCC 700646 / DSM 10631 / Aspo-2) TaxID=643562 RepID=E6VRS9_PSEA9|nr:MULTISPECIES: ATP-binding protein [Pseudodesulfovibrio]MBU4474557.1 ATP-binding protein [Pseudomonadota bacterium]ADU64216.1 ATP-binding region ATPase domain protein [Pseudodesulfovibrio aespoeensis Aspo-2]MBU4516393.1 ATP-binding protein [Pseudomonadota bacterium]MBU4523040.1 ATP-binding protein [Pseudomonadota bacterium]MBU4558006.1 ATP-binding protein [Pseudomonadota bacterium]
MHSISLSIPSRAEAVRWACLAIRGLLQGVQLNDDEKYHVELAVSEAATNSMRHAYDGDPDQEIGLQVSIDPERLIVEVSDTGRSLDPCLLKCACLPPEAGVREDTGGRGLYLIREVMDDVRAERVDGRNVLRMTKNHKGLK